MGALPAPVQRWVTALIPVLAIGVCCAVLIPKQMRLRETNKQIAAARAQIQTYITQLNDIRNLPQDPVVATTPVTRDEQSAFLRALTGLCQRTGNHITSVKSLGPPADPPKADPTKKKKASPGDLPADASSIKTTIAFTGDFRSLIAFLASLSRTHRLISLSDCKVESNEHDYPQLQTTVSLTRYVDMGPTATQASPDPRSAQNPVSSSPG